MPLPSVLVLDALVPASANYVARLKVLRCPHILRFRRVVSHSPSKVWLVTEAAEPLEALALSYTHMVLALRGVLEALDFLHTHARLAHNNVCLAALFAVPTGSNSYHFCLGGLEHCAPVPVKGVSVYPEPPGDEGPLHARDVWQFGHLLQAVLGSGPDHPAEGEAPRLPFDPLSCPFSSLPSLVHSHLPRGAALGALTPLLLHPNPALRPTPRQILQAPFFARHPAVQLMHAVEHFRTAQGGSFFGMEPLDALLAQLSPEVRVASVGHMCQPCKSLVYVFVSV